LTVAGLALNPEQRRAVTHPEGPLLVLAGAGSGKTRVITARIAHLIRDLRVAPNRILAVTFTNKAAREMRTRTRELAGSAVESATISTFHALGARIIREHASLLGLDRHFSIYDRDDQLTVLRAATVELEGGAGDPAAIPLLLGAIGRLKGLGVHPARARAEAADSHAQRVAAVYTCYQQHLRRRNAVDLDALLLLCLQLLVRDDECGRRLQRRCQHVLVDEYQDTNRVQYQIVRALTEHGRNLCVVGDDDQAIYAWRGADVRNILDFRADWSDATEVKLERNYRSTAIILSAANALITHNRDRAPKLLRAEIVGGEKLDFILAPTALEEAQRVVARLERRRRAGVPWSDMALLYRANHLSRAFEDVLRSRTIPYRLVGGHGFYDRREVRDLLAYLRLLCNPDDRVSFERIVNVPRRGIGPKVVAAIDELSRRHRLSLDQALARAEQEPSIRGAARARVREFRDLLQRYRMLLDSGAGLARSARALISEIGFESALRALAKSEEEAHARLENTQELIAALAEFESGKQSPSLADFLERISLLTDSERGRSKDAGVTLMTLHSAKGLEFPHVVLVGFEEGLLPSWRALEEGAAAEDEERRLLYVGITRAKESLLLSAAAIRSRMGRSRPTQLSRYLDEIPPELFVIAPRSIEARFRRTSAGRGAGRVGAARGGVSRRGRRSLVTRRGDVSGRSERIRGRGRGPAGEA